MNSPSFCYSRKTDTPSGGWFVSCPIVNERVDGGDFWDMVQKCESMLLSRGIKPPADFVSQIENNLCNRLPGDSNCVPCSGEKQHLGFKDVVRWVRAMYSFAVQSKFELVPQEEAERRAKICAACHRQISTSGCWGCKGIAGLLPHIAGARKTSYDNQLKACGVCGCYNAVSVHIPLDAIDNEDHLDFPDFCWKKKNPPSNSQSG